MLSEPSHSKKKNALFISVTVIGAIFFLEVFASWALMLRMRLHRVENFTKSELTYFSLLNIPYKTGQKLGLFDRSLDGQRVFTERCAGCHGKDAQGSAKGPRLDGDARLSRQAVGQLARVIRRGSPATGMPRFDLPADELRAVASYIHSMNAVARPANAPEGRRVTWSKPQPEDWLTYNGTLDANRYSELKQINTTNVGSLHLKWIFPLPYFGLEVTPLEAGGVMYVTGPNQVFALDAVNGSQIWKYSRPQTKGLASGDARLGTNRGVAIREDKVFFVTDNAHLLALDRATGSLVWEVTMPEEPQNYGGTLAPLVLKDTVIAGVSGADDAGEGIRGFIACYEAETGKLLWRRWTIPRKGEPGSETWKGGQPPVAGGGSSWLTGSYDAATDTLYWPQGTPSLLLRTRIAPATTCIPTPSSRSIQVRAS